ncbi:MAG: GGDEF domain-containing protein [Kangiellaceae bacterium]|jgi:diguanylate cyclase (GGDEF)-like protein|nr:GGDEF domain-containing protein [Kangiellaceae bacterium]
MKQRRSFDERVLLSLSLLGCIAIFPFAIVRIISEQWLIAAIDFTLAALMFGLFIYVYQTRSVSKPGFILSLLAASGSLISIYIQGPNQFVWSFPAIIAAYYLLVPSSALILSCVTSTLALLLIYGKLDNVLFASYFANIIMLNLFAYFFSYSVQQKQYQLIEQATKDSLTGIGNRRALNEKITEILATFKRTQESVFLIVFDLDYFKVVNDKHGHFVGDHVLMNLITLLKSRIRQSDILYRYGGEEFVIVPLTGSSDNALHFAEELRKLVETSELYQQIKLTISLGIAEIRQDDTQDSWFKRADVALYKAKQLGRNQTCMAD